MSRPGNGSAREEEPRTQRRPRKSAGTAAEPRKPDKSKTPPMRMVPAFPGGPRDSFPWQQDQSHNQKKHLSTHKNAINPSKCCFSLFFSPSFGVLILVPFYLLSASGALPPLSGFSPIYKRVSQARLKRISGSFFKSTRQVVSFVSRPVRIAYEANGTPRLFARPRFIKNIFKRSFLSRSKRLISSAARQQPSVCRPAPSVRFPADPGARPRGLPIGKSKKIRQGKKINK